MARRGALTEPQAKAHLARLGIQVPRGAVARDPAQAAALAACLGVPVVVKVVSPDLTHKSEVGSVRTGLSSPEATEQAAVDVLRAVREARPDARIEGLLVEEHLQGGVECVAGVIGDSVLGPAVMFGLGGLFVELFDDVAFRLAPLTEADAASMIDEVRAARLLTGYRGAPAANRAALVDVLLRLGRWAVSGEVTELDINPLLALPDRAVALDALLVPAHTPSCNRPRAHGRTQGA